MINKYYTGSILLQLSNDANEHMLFLKISLAFLKTAFSQTSVFSTQRFLSIFIHLHLRVMSWVILKLGFSCWPNLLWNQKDMLINVANPKRTCM